MVDVVALSSAGSSLNLSFKASNLACFSIIAYYSLYLASASSLSFYA